tara:strand:- start:4471 stop:4959 length:489 start_codon:yes stop_codon:yes gene_type:complete
MYFFRYLKFLLSATNQHGVHSPFVYAFVTKCLYAKKKYRAQKSVNVLLNVLSYFKVESMHVAQGNVEIADQIIKIFPEMDLLGTEGNFLYVKPIKVNNLLKKITENHFHNESIWFIDEIYKEKDAWQTLIKSEKITVSIDLFYCGIVFFRKEQVKEDFKIRI